MNNIYFSVEIVKSISSVCRSNSKIECSICCEITCCAVPLLLEIPQYGSLDNGWIAFNAYFHLSIYYCFSRRTISIFCVRTIFFTSLATIRAEIYSIIDLENFGRQEWPTVSICGENLLLSVAHRTYSIRTCLPIVPLSTLCSRTSEAAHAVAIDDC